MTLSSDRGEADQRPKAGNEPPRDGRRIAVVTPVFDDWASFALLVGDLAATFDATGLVVDVVAVDDGSTETWDWANVPALEGSAIASIEVIHLGLNLGHQRAIAIGLVDVAGRAEIDAALVMDSDGEDRPADAAALLGAQGRDPEPVLLAHRAERSESEPFKAWYFLYKLMFWILTGRRISFGNFSLLPQAAVRRLTRMPELWNNLPAAIMRSRLPYRMLPTRRGRRYTGRSKMALVSLVTHGLSAMSVYTDVIFVRVLIGAGAVAASTLVGIAVAIFIRLAT